METAVKDRLEDSGAVALVTTPELLAPGEAGAAPRTAPYLLW